MLRYLQSISALIAAALVTFGLFLGLARADDVAQTARARESLGLTRGSFLDRHGLPLVQTRMVKNVAVRQYTVPSLASVVGYQDPWRQWRGLEQRYSSLLDATRVQRDWRTFFLHLTGRSAVGGRVRLTIDKNLQQVADRALGPARGAAIALDPRTGDVLAMVTKPYCAPQALKIVQTYRSCRANPAEPMINRATQVLLSPGSDFKIVTLTAALDSGRFHLNDLFSGQDVFGPSPYFDNSAYPSNVTRADLTVLTLEQTLAFSDNFTFAHVGLTLGAPTLLKYARRYFVGRHIPFDYPVAQSVIANGHASPTLSELAQSSFGGEVDRVTPMQMALVASTVANGGVMMAPHLVKDIEDSSGRVVYRYRLHQLSRVMSASTASAVTTGMIFVVDHGSGFRAEISGMQVAGKTGTAASGRDKPNAWFITFAPARHPVIAVAVLNQFSGEGAEFAAPVARHILAAALRERGFKIH